MNYFFYFLFRIIGYLYCTNVLKYINVTKLCNMVINIQCNVKWLYNRIDK